MRSIIDFPGRESSYGYTVDDDDGAIWCWSFDHDDPDREVEFNNRGAPTNHPIRRTGKVPEAVREHAQQHVDTSPDTTR